LASTWAQTSFCLASQRASAGIFFLIQHERFGLPDFVYGKYGCQQELAGTHKLLSIWLYVFTHVKERKIKMMVIQDNVTPFVIYNLKAIYWPFPFGFNMGRNQLLLSFPKRSHAGRSSKKINSPFCYH
jgi:hypothetical protein